MDIYGVMSELLVTLGQIRDAAGQLEPYWVAAEADAYYDSARRLNKGAEGIANNLQLVQDSLSSARVGTDELRGNIWSTLSQW